MLTQTSVFDPGVECRWIAERFREVATSLPQSGVPALKDPGITPGNIVILLPYALAEACPFDGCAEAARTMALGNAFGTAHFLAQDRVLDGDESTTPEGCHLSDSFLLAFGREYARLVSPASPFWNRFGRYLEEYFASLAWERRVLRTERGGDAVEEGALDETLLRLGQKMSPLKATAAAVSELSCRPELLEPAERLVEAFHAGYQLLDDLEDLEEDLAARRWSAAAWLLAVSSGIDLVSGESKAVELLTAGAASGALLRLTDLVGTSFGTAAGLAEELGAGLLAEHLHERAVRSRQVLEHTASRLGLAAGMENGAAKGAPSPGPESSGHGDSPGDASPPVLNSVAELHSFSVMGCSFVYDRSSGLFFEADAQAVDLIDWLRRGGNASELEVLRLNHGGTCIDEALRELSVLGGDRSHVSDEASCSESDAGPAACPTLDPVVSLALSVSGDCNLSCDYCYLGTGSRRYNGRMSERTAFRAVDLLFAESFGEKELAIVFFGGEPLLNLGLIETVAHRARERAEAEGRGLSLRMTTNGTLLTADVFRSLRSAGISVLVSVDGPRPVHDAHRAFPDGSGSYDAVAENLRTIVRRGLLADGANGRLKARATVTEDSGPLPEVVSHLRGMGFSTVYLSPVSGPDMSREFANRLCNDFESLARLELEALLEGGRPTVGNFLEPILALEVGRKRMRPCGAGTHYVSVAHDGRLFLCHRFAGDPGFAVGDVDRGLDRRETARLLRRFERPARCERCWALGLCGGLCFHDMSAAGDHDSSAAPKDHRCELTRRILELSMWLYASLPAERREELARRAGTAVRPHVVLS